MDTPISRAEHEEFARRMEEEHKRANRRIELLEQESKQVTELALSVRELAISVKKMADEQEQHREKLDELDGRDGEMWRKAVGYIVTAVIGIVIGFVFTQLGM